MHEIKKYKELGYVFDSKILDVNDVDVSYAIVLFLAHLSMECSVSYCDHSPSVIVRLAVHPSVHNLLVNTLASTDINQSSPNLVKMYMTSRTGMSSIMELIGPELSELPAFELENLPYLTVYSLASANIDQSVPNLATIHMPMRAQMSLIMGQIEQNIWSYLPLNLEKLQNLTLFTL